MKGTPGVDQELLRFSDEEVETLAGSIADQLFEKIHGCAIGQYPWEHPVTPAMEDLGDRILAIAAQKLYQRCS